MMNRIMYDRVMEKCTIILTTNTVSIMKGNGSIILNTDKENMCLIMEKYMREFLKKIYIMDKEKLYNQKVRLYKAIFIKANYKGTVSFKEMLIYKVSLIIACIKNSYKKSLNKKDFNKNTYRRTLA